MSTCGGHFKGPLGCRLALDVGKVERVGRLCGIEIGARIDRYGR